MTLTPGRFVGQTLDLRATSSQRGMPSVRVSAIGGVGFSPLALPGLIAWHDASDAATITSSGGAVSQWDDKSGRGNHLAQATAANQPTTGTLTINGLNVIDFDGTNDFLASSATPTTVTDQWAIAMVWSADTAPQNKAPLMIGSGAANGFGLAWSAAAALTPGVLRGGIAWSGASSPTSATGSPRASVLVRINGTISLWVNGTQTDLAVTAAPNAPTTRMVIGSHSASAADACNGQMAETIVWTAPSRWSVDFVTAYLRAKWAT